MWNKKKGGGANKYMKPWSSSCWTIGSETDLRYKTTMMTSTLTTTCCAQSICKS